MLDAVVAKARLVSPIKFSPRPSLADPGDETAPEGAMRRALDNLLAIDDASRV